MAVASVEILVNGVNATGAITQYAAVSGAGAIATAAGRALGFAKTGASIGERAPVVTEGTAVAIAGAAIAVDAALEVGTAGAVITKASGTTVARAMTAATAAGQQIEVLVVQN
ncbi:capsid cement protein [Xylophilus ampelinus]|uniref:Uncharacterized protein n=1 Tax=Xylophilus ampelinus TaxID=54067 RepID=A0A318SKB8_9BURK|nr:capsid cement protein [Xylophilus ampelinus]MCS4508895.1 DUF2190 family protein [Xylophilus ampelinus]PYE79464.1 hypothetical protein DFQ15_102197 [Xylophilus ampelinus]